jgi:outer membrane PBP1 activator LpoA protein
MNTKIALGFSIMPIILAAIFITTMTNLNANAQNTMQQQQQQPVQPLQQQSLNQTVNPQQIKQHLTDAITALNNGNNTQAAKQIELADEKIKSLSGSQSAVSENDDDKNKNIHEGEGE